MGSEPPKESSWGYSSIVTCWLWVLQLELGPHPGWSLDGQRPGCPREVWIEQHLTAGGGRGILGTDEGL